MKRIEKEELEQALTSGKSIMKIAKENEVSARWVYMLMMEYGLEDKLHKGFKFSDEDVKYITTQLNRGMHVTDIAFDLGRSYAAVSCFMKKKNITRAKGIPLKKTYIWLIRRCIWDMHKSVEWVAKEFGWEEDEVRKYMQVFNVQKPDYAFPHRTITHEREYDPEFVQKAMDWMFQTCKYCGKEFRVIDTQNYAYKLHKYGSRGGIFFCSWSHLNRWKEGKSNKWAGKKQEEKLQREKSIY